MFYKIFIQSKLFSRAAVIILFSAALANSGCESPSLKKKDSVTSAANARENIASALEQDLQTMRNADFDFIYVFRRKDDGVFDAEDKKYLKANSPIFTNRFVLSEENKAAIAGSSYKFESQNLEKLQERFVIENFSKPESQDSNSENKAAPNNSNRQENSNR